MKKVGKVLLSSLMALSLTACTQSESCTTEDKEAWAQENGYLKGETALSSWAIANGYLKDQTALANWALANGYLKDETALKNWAINNGYLKDATALAAWAAENGYIQAPTVEDYEEWAEAHGYMKDIDELATWAIANGYLKDQASLANWAINNGYLKDEAALSSWAISNGYLKDEVALANWATTHGYVIAPTDEEYAAWAEANGYLKDREDLENWAEENGYTKNVSLSKIYSYDAETLNYLNTNETKNSDIFVNLVDGLVETDNKGAIQPALATSWSQNGRVWTFNIRNGVKWVDSNGSEYANVTAHDWVTSLKHALESEEVNYLITMFIENSQEYLSATKYAAATTDEERISTAFFQRFAEGYDEEAATAATPSIVWNSTQDEAAFNALLATYSNFENVGVRAVNDYTLEYTTYEESNHFLSVLLYSVYYPANADFIEEVGFENFGSSAETTLYCGAYLLEEWVEDSKVTLVRNKKYYDSHKVYIDTINMIKYDTANASNYAWMRTQYESGLIDTFAISTADTVGWAKYVTGENGTGTIDNPAHEEAKSVVSEMGSGSSFLLFMNRNFDYSWVEDYPHLFKTTFTEAEIVAGNKALSNLNVRKALLYGMDRSYYQEGNWSSDYYNKDQYLSNTFVPKGFVADDNGNDYVEYYAHIYASKNNISLTEAVAKLAPGQDGLTNLTLADTYMAAAKVELEAAGLTLPVKIEYVGLPDENSIAVDQAAIARWNEDLKLPDGTQVIKIVRNDAITTQQEYIYASNYNTGHLTTMGWGPDYADPLTYLDTLTRAGAFAPFAGIANLEDGEDPYIEEYERLVALANAESTPSARLEKFAEAEYYAWHEAAIAIPWAIPGRGPKVVISRVDTSGAMKSTNAAITAKYKYLKIAK